MVSFCALLAFAVTDLFWVFPVHSGECAFIPASTQREQLQVAHWNIYMKMNTHNSSQLSAIFFFSPFTNHLKSKTQKLICHHERMREMHQSVSIAK